MDIVPAHVRSKMMSAVRRRDTKPELLVRKIAHSLGYRFRLYRSDLPGRPDLVFPRFKVALFVHGCFWHSHQGCRKATVPQTNARFWSAKLEGNRRRDERAVLALRNLGWTVGDDLGVRDKGSGENQKSPSRNSFEPRKITVICQKPKVSHRAMSEID